ncbi:hypothetical protein, partial [Propionibacterium sp.]|uniref:hypothetical protein n=1 Tax=Propionibacterium sp. TaxID=1977903 RepID=UPI0039EA6C8D
RQKLPKQTKKIKPSDQQKTRLTNNPLTTLSCDSLVEFSDPSGFRQTDHSPILFDVNCPEEQTASNPI